MHDSLRVYRIILAMYKITFAFKVALNDSLKNTKGQWQTIKQTEKEEGRLCYHRTTNKLFAFLCRARIPSSNRLQLRSRIQRMVENKMKGNKQTGEKKVAVNIFKSQICFSGRPTFGERKTLPYQPRSLLRLFPFIARAFKVLAVRSSVFLVVFASCYENGTPDRFNQKLAHV